MSIDDSGEYSGTDVLEAMAEAEKYNGFLIELINSRLNEDYNVVDFGAGLGTFAIEVERKCANLVCVEPDLKQVSIIASKNLKVVADPASIESRSIDFLYSLNVFEHIKDDKAAMHEVARLLKPNACALIYVPANQILFSALDEKVGHHRRYSKKSLISLFTSENLEIKNIEYVDSVGFFAALMYKTFGNSNGDLSVKSVKIYDRFVFPLSRWIDKFTNSFLGKNLLIEIKRLS